ncbi:hypothetical protein [Thalassovita aquimarina]|uniref:Uncharacterized protein n=1 Tax=Thalassovita aquimarina TaxID=2785917 RepID=A0ABS5HM52_9RHOB|nr:hypothetical protein [Thalassovita aquimarina]MBR9649683.1 hypothetical protein [Thalassovita aquimarina]
MLVVATGMQCFDIEVIYASFHEGAGVADQRAVFGYGAHPRRLAKAGRNRECAARISPDCAASDHPDPMGFHRPTFREGPGRWLGFVACGFDKTKGGPEGPPMDGFAAAILYSAATLFAAGALAR